MLFNVRSGVTYMLGGCGGASTYRPGVVSTFQIRHDTFDTQVHGVQVVITFMNNSVIHNLPRARIGPGSV